MTCPRIEINLNKVSHNAKFLVALYATKNINVIAVMKGVCGDSVIADTLVKSGMTSLADSRISNLHKLRYSGINVPLMLLRVPMLSEAEEVVKSVDISLNSELLTLKVLSKYAVAHNTIHKVILMVELGDLREGIMPHEMIDLVVQVIALEGIKLVGIGTNLACFGGVKPDDNNMGHLSSIANQLEEKFGLQFEFISGGSSANYNWFMFTKEVKRINHLRLGESIYLGCEPLLGKPIPELFTDAFTLIAEVIEVKTKPSLPYGEIGQNAFGNIPVFEDRGSMRRAILGIGIQDVAISGLEPLMDIEILGASSDHLVINTKKISLKVGDEVSFHLNYGALLSAMTSPYVAKEYQASMEYLDVQMTE